MIASRNIMTLSSLLNSVSHIHPQKRFRMMMGSIVRYVCFIFFYCGKYSMNHLTAEFHVCCSEFFLMIFEKKVCLSFSSMFVCVYVWTCESHTVHVEVRGQLAIVGSFLHPLNHLSGLLALLIIYCGTC